MGASCDWSRERFTLDEQLSRKCSLYFPLQMMQFAFVSICIIIVMVVGRSTPQPQAYHQRLVVCTTDVSLVFFFLLTGAVIEAFVRLHEKGLIYQGN